MPSDPWDVVYTLLGSIGVMLLIELLRCLRSIERRVTRIESRQKNPPDPLNNGDL